MVEVSDLSVWMNRLVLDQSWQGGLNEDERRLCIGFVMDGLILAKRNGWDIERMYDRGIRAVKEFAGVELGRAVGEPSVSNEPESQSRVEDGKHRIAKAAK